MSTTSKPLFSFGVIADVQHANIDNAYNYHRTFMRFYRHAIEKFKQAIQTWNENKVDFAIQLGDIIDGFSKRHGHRDKDLENLANVVKEFKSTGLKVRKTDGVYVPISDGCHDDMSPYMCHLWGNHEFYNFSRSDLWNSELNSFVMAVDSSPDPELSNDVIDTKHGYYYSFIHGGIRFIALDSYDIGIDSRPVGSPLHEIAVEAYKKGKAKRKSTGNYQQFMEWNGALSNAQLNWLHNELTAATTNKEKVVLLTHTPIHPMASRAASVIWNYLDILNMIGYFDCVVACLAGHFHEGGYFYDKKSKVHHLTFPGVIERDPETNAYAIIEVFDDCLKVNGYGKLETRTLHF